MEAQATEFPDLQGESPVGGGRWGKRDGEVLLCGSKAVYSRALEPDLGSNPASPANGDLGEVPAP